MALPVDHALDVQQSNVSAEDAAARAVEWTQLARRAVERAGLQQAAYYDRRRPPLEFAVGT